MKYIKTIIEHTGHWGWLPIGTVVKTRAKDAARIVAAGDAKYATEKEWKELVNDED